jgi:hypothetical protein
MAGLAECAALTHFTSEERVNPRDALQSQAIILGIQDSSSFVGK